ncbi:acyl-CoA dehydrogenase family protein [Natronomonas salsuginis]|uniref:Acyl-CoA dehydrogenase n=1 Tax=Natronomonas salsuginis TaxID=2217661 RepID=A0A4U5JCA1_9EURY|nr:acyl-CoA dehydrogenase family protein [Natronomonas salsuginis]TKR26245.1 acyl-CoA dehydrogenase [Natronomonas salsuginis]
MNRDYALTEEHEELREEVRSFAEAEIKPEIERYRESGAFPHNVLDRVAEAGYRGYPYPERYGGEGEELDARAMAIIQEELSRVWKYPAGVLNVSWALVGNPIYEEGTERQREEWLGGLLTGELLGALSMTEPEAGSDVTRATTTAERDGDEWVINGHKHWTSYGEVADLIVVLAKTGDGGHDLSLFGVPMETPGERDGVEFVRNIRSMAGDYGVESEIKYHDLRVPEGNLIGEVDEGFKYAMAALDLGRIGTAAQGVGLAQGAYEAAREYADSREQFDRPIRTFQGVGFKIADMCMDVDAARLLTLQAAGTMDRGERKQASFEAAKAKTYATDVAMDVTTEAVQVHGGVGYSTDYPVERFMREAKGTQIYEGTNEINRQVILNQLYG